MTSADMASLMNMSAKVVRAVEAWRARRVSTARPAGCEHAVTGGIGGLGVCAAAALLPPCRALQVKPIAFA